MSLSPDARALLEATKDAHEPSAEDQARVLAALSVQLGALGVGVAAGVQASGQASAVKLGLGAVRAKLLAKVVAGALFLAAIGGGALFLWAPEPVVPVVIPPAALPTPTAVSVPAAPPASPAASPAPAALRPAAEPPQAVPPSRPSRAPVTVEDPLAAELSLLETAKQALRDHQPARALALTAQHQRRFAQGVLLEEATAVRIQALCEVGRNKESAALRAQFLSQWPRSTLSPMLCPLD